MLVCLISPVAVIGVPIIIGGFFIGICWSLFMMVGSIIVDIIIPFVIPGTAVILLLMYFFSKKHYSSFWKWLKGQFNSFVQKWPSLKKSWIYSMKISFKDAKKEGVEQISYMKRLLIIQYRIAMYIALGFLFLLGVNYALSI